METSDSGTHDHTSTNQPGSPIFEECEMPPIDQYAKGVKGEGWFCVHPRCKQSPRQKYKSPSFVTWVRKLRERLSCADKIRKHARNHIQPVICPYCPVRAAQQADMKKHVRVWHPSLAAQLGIPGQTLTCELCNISISNSRGDNLIKHMENIHGINRP